MCNKRRLVVWLSVLLILLVYLGYNVLEPFRSRVQVVLPELARDIESNVAALKSVGKWSWLSADSEVNYSHYYGDSGGRITRVIALLSKTLWRSDNIREELIISCLEYVFACSRLFSAGVKLVVCSTKLFLRCCIYLSPWLISYTRQGCIAFYEIDTQNKIKILSAVATLGIVGYVKKKRYVSRSLDAISMAHYKTSKFLTFTGPYVLILLTAYLPAKLSFRNTSAFTYILVTTLVVFMIVLSLKASSEFSRLESKYQALKKSRYSAYLSSSAPPGTGCRNQDSERLQTDRLQSSERIQSGRRSAQTTNEKFEMATSPRIMDRLRLLVTPRYVEDPIQADEAAKMFETRYKLSNQVTICLSSWIGLAYYHLATLLPQYILEKFGVRRYNLWSFIIRRGNIADSIVSSPFLYGAANCLDEIVVITLAVAVLVRDTAFARHVRDFSAHAFDVTATKITGFSIKSNDINRSETTTGTDRDALLESPLTSAVARMLPFGEYLTFAAENWTQMRSIFLHAVPLLFMPLPTFMVKTALVVYGLVLPCTYGLRATLAGNATNCHYWLCYFAILNAVALGCYSAMSVACYVIQSSPRLKLLMLMLLQYGIEQPRLFWAYLATRTSPPASQNPPLISERPETASLSRSSSLDNASAMYTPAAEKAAIRNRRASEDSTIVSNSATSVVSKKKVKMAKR
ncbi:putative transmembrane protein [Gregarina niphandrodes]|uniref:Transmembrane protein n=1 Tax=Gregarina niphandrodes TaxID=110365 RepID=A0A023BCQ9_GRENI|nr:putative transmembrane protein [Gregarina niphandrodes]EZG85433.1 putative transmembrane protein [Gregarina niphandrodes]|eukprot:XP_011128829.1 putative transmembrane protein [Gregarina niphandrodes]